MSDADAFQVNWDRPQPFTLRLRPTLADIDGLNQKITHLEQQAIDLRLQLEERDQDLAAARDANRELMAQLNTTARHR